MAKARIYIVLMSTAITAYYAIGVIHHMSDVFAQMAKVAA